MGVPDSDQLRQVFGVAGDLRRARVVAGQFHRDVSGRAGRRRLNALLILAVSELHEAVSIQSNPRYPAFFCGIDERCRAWPQRARLRILDETITLLGEVPVFVGSTIDTDVSG